MTMPSLPSDPLLCSVHLGIICHPIRSFANVLIASYVRYSGLMPIYSTIYFHLLTFINKLPGVILDIYFFGIKKESCTIHLPIYMYVRELRYLDMANAVEFSSCELQSLSSRIYVHRFCLYPCVVGGGPVYFGARGSAGVVSLRPGVAKLPIMEDWIDAKDSLFFHRFLCTYRP